MTSIHPRSPETGGIRAPMPQIGELFRAGVEGRQQRVETGMQQSRKKLIAGYIPCPNGHLLAPRQSREA